jgi:hypothetical protein
MCEFSASARCQPLDQEPNSEGRQGESGKALGACAEAGADPCADSQSDLGENECLSADQNNDKERG